MDIFYGAAIQGAHDRTERAHIHKTLIEEIKAMGFRMLSEHTMGNSKEETALLLEKSIGPLPPPGIERTRYVRKKMIELVESDVVAAVFEVSIPSLGTGIEFAHSYLRPRMGLREIPILVLYQTDYWPNHLSSMIKGMRVEEFPNIELKEYAALEEAQSILRIFLERVHRK